jgi:hypothetical protein
MSLRIKPHPFYEPYWRRVAIVASVAVWLAVEVFIAKDGLWTPLAAGTLAYSFWGLLIAYPKSETKE